MSEFTDGVLFLRTHLSTLQFSLVDIQPSYIVKNLNERWSVVTFDDASGENRDPAVQAWLLKTSQSIPLLAFHNAEDHGWGYALYHRGAQKASLDVNYHIAEGSMLELAEKLHPGLDPYGDLSFEVIDGLYEQVRASESYAQEVAEQYTNPGVDEFSVFGLSADDLAQLREILRSERYEGRIEGLSQVDAFQQVLGIEEMSWVSYHYLSRDDNAGDFDD